jgi:hypothetical protein
MAAQLARAALMTLISAMLSTAGRFERLAAMACPTSRSQPPSSIPSSSGPGGGAASAAAGMRTGRGTGLVDAKTFLANERTFLHWMSTSVMLGGIGAAMSGGSRKSQSGPGLEAIPGKGAMGEEAGGAGREGE